MPATVTCLYQCVRCTCECVVWACALGKVGLSVVCVWGGRYGCEYIVHVWMMGQGGLHNCSNILTVFTSHVSKQACDMYWHYHSQAQPHPAYLTRCKCAFRVIHSVDRHNHSTCHLINQVSIIVYAYGSHMTWGSTHSNWKQTIQLFYPGIIRHLILVWSCMSNEMNAVVLHMASYIMDVLGSMFWIWIVIVAGKKWTPHP